MSGRLVPGLICVIISRVNPLAFDDLKRLPVIEFYEAAFRKATGVPLKVVPPGEPGRRLGFGALENAFCAMVARTPAGCAACWKPRCA